MLATSVDSDQTAQIVQLIRVYGELIVIRLLVSFLQILISEFSKDHQTVGA